MITVDMRRKHKVGYAVYNTHIKKFCYALDPLGDPLWASLLLTLGVHNKNVRFETLQEAKTALAYCRKILRGVYNEQHKNRLNKDMSLKTIRKLYPTIQSLEVVKVLY